MINPINFLVQKEDNRKLKKNSETDSEDWKWDIETSKRPIIK